MTDSILTPQRRRRWSCSSLCRSSHSRSTPPPTSSPAERRTCQPPSRHLSHSQRVLSSRRHVTCYTVNNVSYPAAVTSPVTQSTTCVIQLPSRHLSLSPVTSPVTQSTTCLIPSPSRHLSHSQQHVLSSRRHITRHCQQRVLSNRRHVTCHTVNNVTYPAAVTSPVIVNNVCYPADVTSPVIANTTRLIVCSGAQHDFRPP